ncbi:discoidin domain-containing protein [Microbispora sp. H11081]|uniref:discoidin domain-containing protein n=1 Tax=Microbispora sp. H11081 TaxID=2729107 RepID=UPI001472C02C|nr:discoidin domain-containing protein [Microbispora sp. H11081]
MRRLFAVFALVAGFLLVPAGTDAAVANVAPSATASASYTSPWESVAAINDGVAPDRSADRKNRRWGTWPNAGEQWALLTWPSAQTISSVQVYFFDDGGGVRLPASWRLQSWDGGAYVDIPATYPTAADTYNTVTFPAVTTSRLRVVLRSGQASVGLLEIRALADTAVRPSDWSPPAALVAPLDEVRRHAEAASADPYGARDLAWDKILANGGSVNYCVRWDSTAPVSAELRDGIHAALARSFKKWTDVMAGHNGWPYAEVPVKVVGWAVRDRALLQWSDDSVDVYVGDMSEDAPQCAEPCARLSGEPDAYPGCPGGASHHYDMSLWLTDGMAGGMGGDWGQRVGTEYLTGNLGSDDIHILLHEIGHSFGLDDFYDWTPSGQCCFLMKAGSATSITEFDAWMLRDVWRSVKSRYGY